MFFYTTQTQTERDSESKADHDTIAGFDDWNDMPPGVARFLERVGAEMEMELIKSDTSQVTCTRRYWNNTLKSVVRGTMVAGGANRCRSSPPYTTHDSSFTSHAIVSTAATNAKPTITGLRCNYQSLERNIFHYVRSAAYDLTASLLSSHHAGVYWVRADRGGRGQRDLPSLYSFL